MKILTPAHLYEVSNFEDPSKTQSIQFIEKKPNPDDPIGPCITVNDGTTTEELLSVCKDRLQTLNHRLYSRETEEAIVSIDEAIKYLNRRTNDRQHRGVEGKHQA